MNRHFKRRFSVVLLLCGFLTGCEKPQQRATVAEDEPVETVAPAVARADAATSAPHAEVPPAPKSTTAEPATPLPMEEPLFKIWMVDKKITITGALKSRIQVDRIVETMTEAFSGHQIVNELKVESHRFPVSWGNRLAGELLVPYFKEVKSPGVAYQTGIVTLLGEVENDGRHKALTEIAINTFAGELTQDIHNKITIVE